MKLLSEQEQKEVVAEIMGWNHGESGWYEPGGDHDYSCNREMSKLLALIKSQKIAHADMVRKELLNGSDENS